MILKRKLGLTTLMLCLLNIGLLILLVIAVRWGEGRVHAPEHLTARHLAESDLTLLDAVASPTIDVAAIRDNAVFYAHRTFFQPPPPGQSIPVPEYDFAGSIGLPQGKRVAFVKKKSDKSNRTVHVGDDLDGWRVDSIDAQQVVIVKDTQKIELKSASAFPGSGLVHGTATPYVAQSEMRTIGGGSTPAPHPAQAATREARTYQPPPPRN
jgi:hypothetical protein